MASLSVAKAAGASSGTLLIACVAEHGSASHPYFSSAALINGPDAARNLADAIHFLCALHGRYPGIVDLAASRTIEPDARRWLIDTEEAVAIERKCLTRLAVAAGPVPSTPGGAGSESAVAHQRNALDTLARSDRRGCALGAALAFAVDWEKVRALLDAFANRLGVDIPRPGLGGAGALRVVADEAGKSPAVERALLFGAQQLSLQHRGLWDLLEARQQARVGS